MRDGPPGPRVDALILLRVDPTPPDNSGGRTPPGSSGGGAGRIGIFATRARLNGDGTGRNVDGGGTRQTTTATTFMEEGGRDDGDDNFVVDNAGLLAYVGALVPSEAVKVTTDCVVNGKTVGSSKRRRRRRDEMITGDGEGHQWMEMRRLSHERGLRRRVRAVIIQS